MVSWCDEALGGHLESVHLALVVSDVSHEVCIFVSFLCVSLVNVVFRGTCELKEVDCFRLVVQNYNVWLQSALVVLSPRRRPCGLEDHCKP